MSGNVKEMGIEQFEPLPLKIKLHGAINDVIISICPHSLPPHESLVTMRLPLFTGKIKDSNAVLDKIMTDKIIPDNLRPIQDNHYIIIIEENNKRVHGILQITMDGALIIEKMGDKNFFIPNSIIKIYKTDLIWAKRRVP